MKKNICIFIISLSVIILCIICVMVNRWKNFEIEEVDVIEIIDKNVNINNHNILVPQINGDKEIIENINKMIIKKIELYIDRESTTCDLHYVIQHNDGRFLSLIIEVMQYKKSLPHPNEQAHAINIDLKSKKILDNNDFMTNQKKICEDIKNERFKLLPKNELSNKNNYISDYIKNKTLDEIEKMFDTGELEIFISDKSLGVIVVLPYAIGNYAIFEFEKNMPQEDGDWQQGDGIFE